MFDVINAVWSDPATPIALGLLGLFVLLVGWLLYLERRDAHRIEAARAQEHRGATVRPVTGRLPRTDYQTHFGTEDRHLTDVDTWLVSRDPSIGVDQIDARTRMKRHQ